MKHHIVLKFLALLLCAAMLLSCAAAGLGIFALNEAGLYQRSWQEAYEDYRGDILRHTADAVVARYAAMEQGGLSEEMVDQYYGGEWYLNQFQFGKMGYTIYDEDKNPLQSYEMTGYELAERVLVATSGQEYPRLVTVLTPEERDVELGILEPVYGSAYHSTEGSTTVYDAVPFEGAVVHSITVNYADSSEGIAAPGGLGRIWHDHEGYVVFQSSDPYVLDGNQSGQLQSIRFESRDLGLLYELSDPQGIGLLYFDAQGYVKFQSSVVSPDYAPMPTVPETLEIQIPATEAGVEYNGFSTGANIYAAPHVDAEVLGTLTEEDMALSFREYQVDDGLWYLFEKGWVQAEPVYATLQDNAPEDAVLPATEAVLPGETEIYNVPNREAAPIGTLPAGTQLEIIRSVNVKGESWILVREGWLPWSALEAVPEEPQENTVPEETPAAEETQTAEATAAAETVAPEPAAAMETEASAAAYAYASEELQPLPPDGKYLDYYDRQLGQNMVARYTLEECPGYTVEFRLAENALDGDYAWRMLALVSNFREYLIPTLIGSALLFVILLVYLCCAAGHRPGTQEIMAGGLNRIPLDGWIILLCTGLTGAALMGVEGTEYLMRGSTTVGIVFAAAMGYGAALLSVSFCFAAAAQLKTPGGFWWRNSLCGWCFRLAVWCLAWLIKASRWTMDVLKKHMLPLALRIARALWKFTCAMAVICWQMLTRGLQWLKRAGRRLLAAALRFWELLPMTWQWLLAGFFMIFLLAMTVNAPGLAFWGICGSIAIILYGAHAYGILLGGIKRMNKGDLNNKVDDKLLIGSFREFAGELNGLADVAVVAAQKQLKSERMKTELITNVSHDIKTPLTSIINYVDLMKLPHSEAEQDQYLEVLSRQSQRLKKLIDDLMELSKASTGNMQVDIQIVDAVEAVNQALGEFADKLDRADLQPVFRQSGDSLYMLADGRLVWRVLSNILGNAVKYAQPGTRLYIDVARVEGRVIISMKNISREELNVSADELMERFVRGDTSRNTEGSGLGLNIAQSLMELQKGALQLLVDGDLFKVTLVFPGA